MKARLKPLARIFKVFILSISAFMFLQMNSCNNTPVGSPSSSPSKSPERKKQKMSADSSEIRGEEVAEEVEEIDIDTYKSLFELADENDDVENQYQLGLIAYNRWESDRENIDYFKEAIYWLQKASEQNHLEAKELLMEVNSSNPTVTVHAEDLELYPHLFKLAEKDNDVEAQDKLAVRAYNIYLKKGQKQSAIYKEAKYWLRKAAKNGSLGASELLKKIDAPILEEREEEEKENEESEKDLFKGLPDELIFAITSYLQGEDIYSMRSTNHKIRGLLNSGISIPFNRTGLDLGQEDKNDLLKYSNNWGFDKEIDFGTEKWRAITPDKMPTVFFYRMLGNTANLPEDFWKYIKGSNIHTLTFNVNQPLTLEQSCQRMERLAFYLKNTKVRKVRFNKEYTIHNNREKNEIITFAKALSETNVEEIDIETINIAEEEFVIPFFINLAKILTEKTNVSKGSLKVEISQEVVDQRIIPILQARFSSIQWHIEGVS